MKFLSVAALFFCFGIFSTEGRDLDRAQQTTSAATATQGPHNLIPNDDHMFTGDEPEEFKAHVEKLLNLWPLISGIQFFQFSNSSAAASINFSLSSSSSSSNVNYQFGYNKPNEGISDHKFSTTAPTRTSTRAFMSGHGEDGDGDFNDDAYYNY